jgi:hypothetical protein
VDVFELYRLVGVGPSFPELCEFSAPVFVGEEAPEINQTTSVALFRLLDLFHYQVLERSLRRYSKIDQFFAHDVDDPVAECRYPDRKGCFLRLSDLHPIGCISLGYE